MQTPSDINDIKLYQWIEFVKYLETKPEENQIAIMAISLFCDVSTESVRKMKRSEQDGILSQLNKTISQKPNFQAKFTLNDIDYGFIPNLDKLTIGEFVDLETYQASKDDLWKIMSVLYRPVKDVQPYGHYSIAEYDGQMNEDFKGIPAGIALGAHVFFCDLGKDLLSYILKSLEGKTRLRKMQHLQALLKSGDGLDSFLDCVTEMSSIWMMFRESLFIKPLCFQATKSTGVTYKKKS